MTHPPLPQTIGREDFLAAMAGVYDQMARDPNVHTIRSLTGVVEGDASGTAVGFAFTVFPKQFEQIRRILDDDADRVESHSVPLKPIDPGPSPN